MRLRLVVPRRRRGTGLRSLRSRLLGGGALVLAVVIVVVVVLVSGGGEEQPATSAPTPPTRTAAPRARAGHARARHRADRGQPGAHHDRGGPGGVRGRPRPRRGAQARVLPADGRLAAPAAAGGRAADWDSPSDGCLRGTPPCAESAGIRAILRAIHARQQADGGWQVVVTFYGTPGLGAARRGRGLRHGPPRRTSTPTARSSGRSATSPRQESVAVHWWSPWNEPNHPEFLGPQRTECRADADALTPTEYANIAYAMQAELGPGDHLVLGEVAGYDRRRAGPCRPRSSRRTSPRSSCARATCGPSTPTCARRTRSRRPATPATRRWPATPTRRAIRCSCATSCARSTPRAASAATGSGSRRPAWAGRAPARTARPTTPPTAGRARRWTARCAPGPRTPAWTPRSSTRSARTPSFPVGLADAGLDRLYRSYDAWQAWSTPGAPPGAIGCAQPPALD